MSAHDLSTPRVDLAWVDDEREASRFLNYPGDVRDSFHAYRPLGPTVNSGEWLWPVDASYDEAADRTRVGLSKESPAGVCRKCSCTDARACVGGCSWVEPNLCSRCAA